MKYTIICACGKEGEFGYKGELPWKNNPYFKWDMKHFKEKTTNNVVIMGYKTYLTTGPLKNRYNYIVKHGEVPPVTASIGTAVMFYESLEDIDQEIENNKELFEGKELFIIGGIKIIQEALDKKMVNKIILTQFPVEFKADTYFPLARLVEFRIKSICNEYDENKYYRGNITEYID